MYGYYDPYVIYGFAEGNRNNVIDSMWLEENGLQCFALDVVKLYCGEPVYGVIADWYWDDGSSSISKESKELVDKLAAKCLKTPRFFIALSGDYSFCHDVYIP